MHMMEYERHVGEVIESDERVHDEQLANSKDVFGDLCVAWKVQAIERVVQNHRILWDEIWKTVQDLHQVCDAREFLVQATLVECAANPRYPSQPVSRDTALTVLGG